MEFNLFTIFATMVNFIVLIAILKHFLFKKVSDVIETRNNEILENINSAETKNLEAEKLVKSYEKQLADLEGVGRDIVKDAKVKADAQAKEILDESQARSVQLLKQTEVEIERLKKKALEDMKQEIGALAIFAAEKILEKQLDHQEQQDVIGKIIDEAGNATWQS
ncbi:F0F1 ATP synthase subunit B [Clostridium aminobutyricum]|uniref:ATP synthase subunit b n=1 Tax=Clostridium aminobutyricum TaxID=33953 RepID=A0A939D8F8_CLOAM|nr:F0F1 ATP synthase subunit B [Clostridium aminobutyricum]MBN7773071.1 F0F1 ATP synthase subunit B [Clostridium aminobutyricum]